MWIRKMSPASSDIRVRGKPVKFQFWVNRAFNADFFVFLPPPSRVSLSTDLLTLSFIFLCFFTGPQTCFSLNSFRRCVISSLTHSTSSSLSSQTSLRFLFLPLLLLSSSVSCPSAVRVFSSHHSLFFSDFSLSNLSLLSVCQRFAQQQMKWSTNGSN